MTIQSADVRQHLNELIGQIFPSGANISAWAAAWNLVLGLIRRYSTTGITLAILRAEAHSIVDAIQSTRWQPLSNVNESSHDYRCRVRVLNVQPLLPSSPTLVATVSDIDEITTRAAFIHRRYAQWALQWKTTTLRLGGVRLAANRILPTEQIVEEIAANSLNEILRRDGHVVGRISRRRDIKSADLQGTCITLQGLNTDNEIHWFSFAQDAGMARLVFAGEVVVIENFDRELNGEHASLLQSQHSAQIVITRYDTIVRVVNEVDIEALKLKLDCRDDVPSVSSQFNDALSQVNLTQASQFDSDPDLFDAHDFDGQRPTIKSVLDVKRPVVNVSLTAIIMDIDRQRQLCYVTDASRAALAIRLDFVQSQTWEQGQTLFLYRLQSSDKENVLIAISTSHVYNLSYALGLLASPNLYRLVLLPNRPRILYSMFICRISIAQVELPESFSHRWHERVILEISDSKGTAKCGISPVALESLLTCPLAVFASLDYTTRTNLVNNAVNREMLAMLTNMPQDLLRLEIVRQTSSAPRPSVYK